MICKNCKTRFTKKIKNQKFCSRKCGISFKNKQYRLRKKSEGKPHRGGNTTYYLDKPCAQCGKIIGEKQNKNQTFCSLKCSGLSKKKFLDIPECLNSASRKIDKNIGYIRVYAPMHNEANTWGYVYEHRLIAEEKILGRKLAKDEIVHHKNGKRWDNRVVNLEVMNKADHAKLFGQREEDLDI